MAQTLHAWVVVPPLQLVLVVVFLPPTGTHTPLALEQLALCVIDILKYIHVIYIHIQV